MARPHGEDPLCDVVFKFLKQFNLLKNLLYPVTNAFLIFELKAEPGAWCLARQISEEEPAKWGNTVHYWLFI